MVILPTLLPSFIGFECEREVKKLSEALIPEHPAIALLGGAKFETKIPLIEKILLHYDKIFLGGALANDMLKTRGFPFGASLISNKDIPTTLAGDSRIELPIDAVLEKADGARRTSTISDTHKEEKLMDIGPHTATKWAEEIMKARFVLWNGPMGVYEKGYGEGSDAIARALSLTSAQAVVGGGDTEAAIRKNHFDPERVFISTGGGAMLEFLVTGTLPALEALKQ
jgi:phosphoglycerate kinase